MIIENEEADGLAYEHPEPGVVPEAEATFTGGDMHINYEVEAEGIGVDKERLDEELSDV